MNFSLGKYWFFITVCLAGAFAEPPDAADDDVQKAVVFVRAAFVFPEPDETVEIVKMLRKGHFVTTIDKKVDSLDRMWYKIKDKSGDLGRVESHDLRILSKADGEQKPEDKLKTISKLTKRQRMRYIKSNPSLSLRTKKLIKDGFVGMGMRPLEVRASLGPPDAVRTVMLLKSEERTLWIYRLKDPVIFIFKGNKVAGWSTD